MLLSPKTLTFPHELPCTQYRLLPHAEMWGKSVQLMILRTIIAINSDNQLKERNILSSETQTFFFF